MGLATPEKGKSMSFKDKLNNMSDTEKDRFLRYAASRGTARGHDSAMNRSGNPVDQDTPERSERFKELWEVYLMERAAPRANATT